MAMRLQEIHPALVHFPIALLPASLAADALGRATGNEGLMELGRRTLPLAAASGLLAGAFGLIAQQTVNLDEEATRMLITHRTLNLGAVVSAFLLARRRNRKRRPDAVHFAAGLAALGTVTYSAYLGGRMVYEKGVGVNAAGGLREEKAPEVTLDSAGEAARLAGQHLLEGIQLAAEEMGQGKLVPQISAG